MSEARSRPRRSSRRGDTRKALINGAFTLLDGQKSFDGLSQRELTRYVGIVPTAFYRHFASMDELGQALVDEAFRALRQILEDVRTDVRGSKRPVSTLVRSLLQHVRAHRSAFRFIAAERFGGAGGIRGAIRREMRLVQAELAVELARFPYLKDWSSTDLHMIAALMVNAMVAIVEEVLDRSSADKAAEAELMALAEKHLRLVVLGIPHWRSQA